MKKICLFLMSLCFSLPVWAEKIPFQWKHKRAVVTETKEKNGKSLTIQYPIELKKQAKNWQLRFGKTQFIEFNGKKISPEMAQLFQTLLNQTALKPNLLIDQAGNPIKVIDWQGYLKGIGKILPKNQNNMLQNLSSMPELEQQMYLKVMTEPWCTWVCNWTDNDIQENSEFKQNDNQVLGVKLKEKSQYRLIEKTGDFITVEMKIQADVTGLSDKNLLTNQPLTKKEKDEMKKRQIKRENVVTATFHQKTGEPQKVVSRMQILQKNQVVRTENIIYEFHW